MLGPGTYKGHLVTGRTQALGPSRQLAYFNTGTVLM